MGAASLRIGYLLLGILCVGLGFIGFVLPVMPGTVFFIIALWSFKRSSPRLENWLLTRSPVASTLQDWDRDRSMKRSTKLLAIGMIWIAILGSILGLVRKRNIEWRALGVSTDPVSYLAQHPMLLLPPLLFVTACALTVYISTRKTKILTPSGT